MDKITWGYVGLSVLLGVLAVYMRDNTVFLISLITAMVLMKILLAFGINKAIKYLWENLDQVVNGQLNVNIKKSNIKAVNQVRDKINEYLEKIRTLVGQYISTSEITDKESNIMKTQAENLRIAASEIASTTQSIAESVNSQAESTGRVSSSVEVFSRGVEEIYENANLSLEVAMDSKVIVAESFGTLREAFLRVEEIKDYNDKVMENMTQLDRSIKQISIITEAVEAIASQTQLLSLNASIEAARAGEAGRGFAVVAGEVSKLADDSSVSAKQIKELVDGITQEISRLTQNIKTQTDVIVNNVVFAKKALEKSDSINAAVDKNQKAAETIVKLTAKQKENISDIAHATNIINETTQQNAAVSEEITAETEEQLSIIESMYNSVINLNSAIASGNKIIENFISGFRITADMQRKVEETKKLLTAACQEELTSMDEAKLSGYLKEKQRSLDYIELMFVTNRVGMIIGASMDIANDLRDRSARPYFQTAIKGETFVSKEYISSFTNHYNISVVMPLYEKGQISGVILADINLNED